VSFYICACRHSLEEDFIIFEEICRLRLLIWVRRLIVGLLKTIQTWSDFDVELDFLVWIELFEVALIHIYLLS
jgi:hypothetical protein